MTQGTEKTPSNGADSSPDPATVEAAAKARKSAASAPRAKSPDSARQEGLMAIGKSTRFEGRIEECESCVVAGAVKGHIAARHLEIDADGRVEGEVHVEDAVIAGQFNGQLTVSGRLQLKSGAQVMGEISYAEIEIETGARLIGRIQADGVTYEPSGSNGRSLLGRARK